MKHSTAFSDGLALSALINLGVTGNNNLFFTNFDAFQAPSNTAFVAGEPIYYTHAGIAVTITLTSNVNLDTLTAGSIDVSIKTSTLP